MSIRGNIINEIDSKKEKYINISHAIHEHPEIGNEEFFASDLLTKTLKEADFTIEKAVAGHPTSFIARKKSSKKDGATIGFLAEYDALAGLGHGCGHNIIGTLSVAAAIALSHELDETGGEVVVLGTPAEEGGDNGSAKASFVKYNLLEGIDACLQIHPGSENKVTGNLLANIPLDFEYFGKPAHASGAPEKGINALDAVILLFNGISALRQHVTTDVRIHGIITDGGYAPNIIPEYAKARFYIRANTIQAARKVVDRVKNIAEGAALATGAKLKVTPFQNEVDNQLINNKFDELFVEVSKTLGLDVSTEVEKGVGSSDVGNISQVVPTIQPNIKIGDNLLGHSPEFRDAAISEEGDEALIVGAKALSLTALTLLTDQSKLNEIKDEFKERKNL